MDVNGVPPVIWHYPVSELPQNPTARFVCVCVCVCLSLPSKQRFYRLIAGYWMGGGDHQVYQG